MTQKTVYKKLNNLLCECLSKAIEIEFQRLLGDGWFDDLKSNDISAYNGNATLLFKTSLAECSTSEFAQILLDNEHCRDILIDSFNREFNDVYGDSSQLVFLLRRLLDADEVEKHLDKNENIIYGFDELARDILKLGELFSVVANDDDEYYFEKMQKVYDEYLNDVNTDAFPIDDTIESEELKISKSKFFDICKDIGYDVIVENDRICFCTRDYDLAIKRIRERIAVKKTKRRLFFDLCVNLVIILCCVTVAYSFVLNFIDDNPFDRGEKGSPYVQVIEKINATDSSRRKLRYFYLDGENKKFNDKFFDYYNAVEKLDGCEYYPLETHSDDRENIILGIKDNQVIIKSFPFTDNYKINCSNKKEFNSNERKSWNKENVYNLCAADPNLTSINNFVNLDKNIYYINSASIADYYKYVSSSSTPIINDRVVIYPKSINLRNKNNIILQFYITNGTNETVTLDKYDISWASGYLDNAYNGVINLSSVKIKPNDSKPVSVSLKSVKKTEIKNATYLIISNHIEEKK